MPQNDRVVNEYMTADDQESDYLIMPSTSDDLKKMRVRAEQDRDQGCLRGSASLKVARPKSVPSRGE
ncbi:4675_t:CDS:2, partial [Acaulospora colombiana]